MTGWRRSRSCWRGVIRAVLGVGAVLLGLGAVGQAHAGERMAGYVVTVEGLAYLQGARDARWVPLAVRQRVSFGDQLMTLGDSRVQLHLRDHISFVLGPDSQMELSEPARGARERSIRMNLGSFHLLVPLPARGARVLVMTPTAVTAVRGTLVLGEGDEKNTTIVVVRGEAEVRGTAKGGTVRVRAGQGTDVADGQDPTEPVEWPKERLERLRDATAVKLSW